jgi:hypothetical protein
VKLGKRARAADRGRGHRCGSRFGWRAGGSAFGAAASQANGGHSDLVRPAGRGRGAAGPRPRRAEGRERIRRHSARHHGNCLLHLDRGNLAGLESAVESGQAPDLSVPQFASRYGQTAAAIGALGSYLNQYGITTTIYPDDLDVVANGTAGEFDSALNVQQQQYEVPSAPAHDGMGPSAATQVHGTVQEPYLPASIAPSVLAVLGLTSSTFDATPATQHGSSSGRATPDLVADADPFTGYLLYDPLATPALQSGWGGTSFVAPQLNAAAALIDQVAGHRTGLWNPAIYRFAASADSPFTQLSASGTGNDNLYFTGTPGQVFHVGSGLGYPDLAKLAAPSPGNAGPPGGGSGPGRSGPSFVGDGPAMADT